MNYTMLMERSPEDSSFLAEGLQKCKEITRKYGTSFYFATQFFPRETRDGIYAIYAFARIPDEIVDDHNKIGKAESLAELNQWREKWLEAMSAGCSDDAVMNAIVKAFRKYKIPVEEGEAFLRSMFMDEEKASYANYAELEEYMYGSAGVIGLMVTRVVGFSSEAAFPHALKLGYAFQLTNFLRDIKEDFFDLGRVYMPQDELARFGLSNEDIERKICDERFIAFMKWQIERNREVYKEALPGIPMLAWRGRLAVRVSYVLYKAILGEIERANYNVYLGRVRTTFRQKVWLSMKALAGIYE
ncbi:MAG: phytoene/squalene synthase family protein [Chloracidobacterium sp.]|nr:phytoene/squalene synthase family protein [Chloracidobacterium sp.]